MKEEETALTNSPTLFSHQSLRAPLPPSFVVAAALSPMHPEVGCPLAAGCGYGWQNDSGLVSACGPWNGYCSGSCRDLENGCGPWSASWTVSGDVV
ncbi:hypothetical protein MTO96_032999 [Rhipicephalus appendiculatus]